MRKQIKKEWVNLNAIQFTGNVANVPEFIDEKKLSRFMVVIQESHRGEECDTFLEVKHFGEQFNMLKENLVKGARVGIEGAIKTDKKYDGERWVHHNVIYARKVMLLSGRKEIQELKTNDRTEATT